MAAAEPALAVVGAAGVAAPEGVVRVAAACGNPVAGLGVELLVPVGLAVGVDLEVEADPVAEAAPVELAVVEVEPGPVAVPAVLVELAPAGREAEESPVHREDG